MYSPVYSVCTTDHVRDSTVSYRSAPSDIAYRLSCYFVKYLPDFFTVVVVSVLLLRLVSFLHFLCHSPPGFYACEMRPFTA